MTTERSQQAWSIVSDVEDPELPHVTLGDLGIVREVRTDGAKAIVTLTPTYSGCPATEQIRDDVEAALSNGGFESDVTFAQVTLSAYKATHITQVSEELLQDSAFDIAGLVAEVMGTNLGVLENTAFVNGTGSAQPRGVLLDSTAGLTAASATTIASDEIIELSTAWSETTAGTPGS